MKIRCGLVCFAEARAGARNPLIADTAAVLPAPLPRGGGRCAMDEEALTRILDAVGSKFIPANLDLGGLVVDADHWREESTRKIAPASGHSPGGRRPQTLAGRGCSKRACALQISIHGIRSTDNPKPIDQLRESGARAARRDADPASSA